MKIDVMRKIDYFVGIPICFFISLLCHIQHVLQGKRGAPLRPRKVLFIELSEMGSAVMAYASLMKVREFYPEAEVFFLIFEENRFSVHVLGAIPERHVLTISNDSLSSFLRDTFRIIVKMRRMKIDVVIDLELFSRITSILSFLSGAPWRVGFYSYHNEGLYRGSFQTHKIHYNPHHHISMNYMAMVHALKAPHGERPLTKIRVDPGEITVPQVHVSDDVLGGLWEKLGKLHQDIGPEKKIIVLSTSAGLLPIRAWPLENYIKLTWELLKDPDLFVVIIGVKEAVRDGRAITESVKNDRCLDFTAQTTFEEVVALLSVSRLLITNDGGPAHFAALTAIPSIVFFGPETPALYRPISDRCVVFHSDFACSPCLTAFNHRNSSCRDNKCLQGIRVGEVLEKARERL